MNKQQGGFFIKKQHFRVDASEFVHKYIVNTCVIHQMDTI